MILIHLVVELVFPFLPVLNYTGTDPEKPGSTGLQGWIILGGSDKKRQRVRIESRNYGHGISVGPGEK